MAVRKPVGTFLLCLVSMLVASALSLDPELEELIRQARERAQRYNSGNYDSMPQDQSWIGGGLHVGDGLSPESRAQHLLAERARLEPQRGEDQQPPWMRERLEQKSLQERNNMLAAARGDYLARRSHRDEDAFNPSRHPQDAESIQRAIDSMRASTPWDYSGGDSPRELGRFEAGRNPTPFGDSEFDVRGRRLSMAERQAQMGDELERFNQWMERNHGNVLGDEMPTEGMGRLPEDWPAIDLDRLPSQLHNPLAENTQQTILNDRSNSTNATETESDAASNSTADDEPDMSSPEAFIAWLHKHEQRLRAQRLADFDENVVDRSPFPRHSDAQQDAARSAFLARHPDFDEDLLDRSPFPSRSDAQQAQEDAARSAFLARHPDFDENLLDRSPFPSRSDAQQAQEDAARSAFLARHPNFDEGLLDRSPFPSRSDAQQAQEDAARSAFLARHPDFDEDLLDSLPFPSYSIDDPSDLVDSRFSPWNTGRPDWPTRLDTLSDSEMRPPFSLPRRTADGRFVRDEDRFGYGPRPAPRHGFGQY